MYLVCYVSLVWLWLMFFVLLIFGCWFKLMIVVVILEGLIVNGCGGFQFLLFGLLSVGGDIIVVVLWEVVVDDLVLVIVLWVDSLGGLVIVLEIIWCEVVRVCDCGKLVVVLMGVVVVFGGYYVLMGVDVIVVNLGIIIGLIGVIIGKLVVWDFKDWLGVGLDVVCINVNVDVWLIDVFFILDQQVYCEVEVDLFYSDFVECVVEGCKMIIDVVDVVV